MSADVEARVRKVKFIAFDFDGVFTDNSVLVFADGTESVRCWRGDGLGLRKLDKLRIGYAIISTEVNEVVLARSKKLHIHCIHGCDDKLGALNKLLDEHGLSLDQTAFVGNDINDACCLAAVGLPIVVEDAHPDVRKHGAYRTRARGGYGAVREVCDIFEQVLTGNRK